MHFPDPYSRLCRLAHLTYDLFYIVITGCFHDEAFQIKSILLNQVKLLKFPKYSLRYLLDYLILFVFHYIKIYCMSFVLRRQSCSLESIESQGDNSIGQTLDSDVF